LLVWLNTDVGDARLQNHQHYNTQHRRLLLFFGRLKNLEGKTNEGKIELLPVKLNGFLIVRLQLGDQVAV
jgi:tmRNA-binding protein